MGKNIVETLSEKEWFTYENLLHQRVNYKFNQVEKELFIIGFITGYRVKEIKEDCQTVSMPSRGQKCTCNHARIKHEKNAGGCKECDCKNFVAVKHKQMRLKDSRKKEAKPNA